VAFGLAVRTGGTCHLYAGRLQAPSSTELLQRDQPPTIPNVNAKKIVGFRAAFWSGGVGGGFFGRMGGRFYSGGQPGAEPPTILVYRHCPGLEFLRPELGERFWISASVAEVGIGGEWAVGFHRVWKNLAVEAPSGWPRSSNGREKIGVLMAWASPARWRLTPRQRYVVLVAS